MKSSSLIALVVVAALGTYFLRASFLSLIAGDKLPDWARRGLRYVPPAVLSALAVPAFLPAAWPPEGPGVLARPVAAIAAMLVAWRWGNILLTIGTGMITLWILNALL